MGATNLKTFSYTMLKRGGKNKHTDRVNKKSFNRIVGYKTKLNTVYKVCAVLLILSKFSYNVLVLISLIKNEIAKSIYLVCRDLPDKKIRRVQKVYTLHHVGET